MLVSLVVTAITFVFALFFLTGSLSEITYYITAEGGDTVNATAFVEASQKYVGTLVTLGIVFIVLAALLFITSCHSRRKYYITNYIAVGLFVAFALVMAIYIIIMVTNCMDLFLNDVNWSIVGSNGVFLGTHPIYKTDTYPFTIGYIVAAIVLVDAVLVVLSTVWKVLLMQGEKKLLENAAHAEEVA